MPVGPAPNVGTVTAVQPPSGADGDVLSRLRNGAPVEATVLGTLKTGEVRLALVGVLLDIVAPEALAPGQALKLRLTQGGGEPVLLMERQASAVADDIPSRAAPSSSAQPAGAGAAAPSASPAPGDAAEPEDSVRLSPMAARIVAAQADAGAHEAAAARPAAPMSPHARAALAETIPQAAAGQQSRAPLLATALAVLSGAGGDALPEPVKRTLAALVATALDASQLDAPALKSAVGRSGTFQEAALARLAQDLGAAVEPNRLRAEIADLRGDTKTLALSLKAMLQGAETAPPHRPADQPPPQRGVLPRGHPPVAPMLPADAAPQDVARTLLDGAGGTLDRIRLLQAASLPDGAGQADRASRGERLVELPLALPGGQMPVMSLAVGREGRAAAEPGEAPGWRMRLSLDLGDTGPMHALVSVHGAAAGVTLWAEREATAERFRESLGELRDALTVADLDVETLDVRGGAPAEAAPAQAGTFLDRRS